MPVTQTRLLALVHAAQDYQQGFRKALALAEGELSLLASGHTTPEQAIASLRVELSELSLLEAPIESSKVVALEAQHLRQNFARNQRAAERQAERRNLARASPTAPRKLERPAPLSPEARALLDAEAEAGLEDLLSEPGIGPGEGGLGDE